LFSLSSFLPRIGRGAHRRFRALAGRAFHRDASVEGGYAFADPLYVADAVMSDVSKVQMDSLSEADARGRKQLLRLLKHTEKDAKRKEKYGKILGEEAARIFVKETEGDIFSLMDYWYKRRHALFITTSVK
jgi:hypothetical protein